MPRPPITDWTPVARGYQCSVREPYQDLEVVPDGDRWAWSLVVIDPATGIPQTVPSKAQVFSRGKSFAPGSLGVDNENISCPFVEKRIEQDAYLVLHRFLRLVAHHV